MTLWSDATGDLDRDALRRGVAIAGGLGVPIAVLSWLVNGSSSEPGGGAVALFTLAVLAALVGGAYVAARHQNRGRPLTHGLVAVLIVFVVLQVIRLVRQALADDGLQWSRTLSNLLLTIIAGSVGAVLGGRAADKAR